VLVTDNQAVKAGDPLVRISGIDTSAQAAQLTAELAAAQAAVAQSISRVYSQDAAIRSARADQLDARSQVNYLQGEVQRHEPLTRSGAESGEKLAQLRQQRDGAQAGLERAGAQAVLAVQQRDAFAAEVDGARARVAAIRAQQQRANSDVALSILRSSINGRIGDSGVRVGQYVRPGQKLMSVVPIEHIYVVANFKETQVKRMRIGQPVDIAIDALDDVPLKGRVESFAPGTGSVFALLPPQNATGNFTKIVQRVPVRIKLDGALPAGRVIVPGMSVVARVDTSGNKN
jgi:membrane fusion protein (multidrug efflux system)